jgi:hypothetical protein
MTERRVWIAQCLCPDRHCIIASAGEAESEAEVEAIRAGLRRMIVEGLRSGTLTGWCGLCGAKRATWRYEVGRTRFASMAEAQPALDRLEAENLLTRAVWGDLHKTIPH